MVISLRRLIKPLIAVFILLILFSVLLAALISKSGHPEHKVYKPVEIFDISKECVVKKTQLTPEIQKEVRNCLGAITNIYTRLNPIPQKGFMVKIPLSPSIAVKNQWLNTLADEVIIIFPEQSVPYLMIFEDGSKPLFLTFEYNTDVLLKSLNFDPERSITSLKTTDGAAPAHSILSQSIRTALYSVSIPSEWKSRKFSYGYDVDFYKDDKRIGWLCRLGYLVFGNHYEILEEKHLGGFPTDVLMVRLAREKPAAENDNAITEELHFYLPYKAGDRKLGIFSEDVYDIVFLTSHVDEYTALEIVKSFNIIQD